MADNVIDIDGLRNDSRHVDCRHHERGSLRREDGERPRIVEAFREATSPREVGDVVGRGRDQRTETTARQGLGQSLGLMRIHGSCRGALNGASVERLPSSGAHVDVGRAGDRALVPEQPPLPVQAAPIARQRTVAPDHPMAGDDDRHRVPAVCRANRAAGGRPPDRPRELGVGYGRPGGHAAKHHPYLALEGSAAGLHQDVVHGAEVTREVSVDPTADAERISGRRESHGAIARGEPGEHTASAIAKLKAHEVLVSGRDTMDRPAEGTRP